MPPAPRLADVVAVLEELYDPRWAEPWDAVGLVCGDPEAEVGKVLLAVDPVAAVAEEALAWGADLVVTHHPLFLRGVHGVPATTPKGRLVHRLVSHGVALHVAHTNADTAAPGVSDALAAAIGLAELRPLSPTAPDPVDKIVAFVPRDSADRLVDALAAAGAGSLGDYTRVAYLLDGTGTFRPEPGARPAIGGVGRIETVAETRVEMLLPRGRRRAAVEALRATHPYEEPAFDVIDVIETADRPGPRGLGRVGRLASPTSLRELGRRVAAALPATPAGVRVGGDLDRTVATVAVCGGAGDSLFDEVRRSGADAYVTADLRHHPVSEALSDGAFGIVDAAHWATEWPWLADAARRLPRALGERGTSVAVRVSTIVTDPWGEHLPASHGQGSAR
ncbi:MAG: Nif3-like dinuclear metal center hexameric protein [Actinomycetota bacterium]|nr:Nif3-like dinuclear metal center hexameric protein [Actinomycetota bacterium]